MKRFSRIVAVLMVVAILASVFAACGKKEIKDERLYATWKQTDKIDGNWTWIFNADGTCSLTNDDTNETVKGTFKNEGDDYGKLRIKLDTWDKETLFTYSVTDKVLDIEGIKVSYYLLKQ